MKEHTPTLAEWTVSNAVNEKMVWIGAAAKQVLRFQKMADEMNAPIHVISTHVSKSITLPVVRITGSNGTFVIRNNFDDYNLAVEWDFPVTLPMEDVYRVMTWEEYFENIKRAESYCHWCDWTEEELNDPRITRIEIRYGNGRTDWRDCDIEKKERWLKRFESTEWYRRDWSHAELIPDGEMKEGCRFFVADYPYGQGIPSIMQTYDRYRPGKTHFFIALDEVAELIKKINGQETNNA